MFYPGAAHVIQGCAGEHRANKKNAMWTNRTVPDLRFATCVAEDACHNGSANQGVANQGVAKGNPSRFSFVELVAATRRGPFGRLRHGREIGAACGVLEDTAQDLSSE